MSEPMASVVRRQRRQQQPPASPERDGALPLRWGLIIVVALGTGLAVGSIVSLVPGITVGIAVGAFLHKVLAKE